MSNTDGEFLRIPKPLRELRGVSWPAKALAAHVRFRQRDREKVSIGIRRLSKDLGMAHNTVCRAALEANRKRLLRIVNPKAPQGVRRVYDARPLDTLQSDATLETLSAGGKCRSPCDTSDSRVASAECISPCDRSDAPPATRKEDVKKNSAKKGKESPPAPPAHGTRNGNDNGDHHGDPDVALLGVAESVRGRPMTGKERSSFCEAIAEAREAGATDIEIANEIQSAAELAQDNGRPPPVWTGPNAARDAARGRLAELLASYQRAAHLPDPRKTLTEIVADVQHARRRLAQTPQPDPGDEGAALWRNQLAWAERHAADLAAASVCDSNPRLARQDGPRAARASG